MGADRLDAIRARANDLINGATAVQYASVARTDRLYLLAELERLQRRLFPSQGESYANEVERQRVVIDGLQRAASAARADLAALRAALAATNRDGFNGGEWLAEWDRRRG